MKLIKKYAFGGSVIKHKVNYIEEPFINKKVKKLIPRKQLGGFVKFGRTFISKVGPKITKKLLLMIPTFMEYKGPTHSVSELFKKDGTINLKNVKKIHDEVVANTGGIKASLRKENPVWHKTDPNTFQHTKLVVLRAYQAGYNLDLIAAALLHDMGKLVAGEGHGPIGASLVSLIFTDIKPELLQAIYDHMDDIPVSTLGKLTKGVDIAEPNIFRIILK